MPGSRVQAAVPSDGRHAEVPGMVAVADCWQWCRGSAVEGLGWRGAWYWSWQLGLEPEAVPSGFLMQAVVPSDGRAAGYVQVEEEGMVVDSAQWYPSEESVGVGLVRQGNQETE